MAVPLTTAIDLYDHALGLLDAAIRHAEQDTEPSEVELADLAKHVAQSADTVRRAASELERHVSRVPDRGSRQRRHLATAQSCLGVSGTKLSVIHGELRQAREALRAAATER